MFKTIIENNTTKYGTKVNEFV